MYIRTCLFSPLHRLSLAGANRHMSSLAFPLASLELSWCAEAEQIRSEAEGRGKKILHLAEQKLTDERGEKRKGEMQDDKSKEENQRIADGNQKRGSWKRRR